MMTVFAGNDISATRLDCLDMERHKWGDDCKLAQIEGNFWFDLLLKLSQSLSTCFIRCNPIVPPSLGHEFGTNPTDSR